MSKNIYSYKYSGHGNLDALLVKIQFLTSEDIPIILSILNRLIYDIINN